MPPWLLLPPATPPAPPRGLVRVPGLVPAPNDSMSPAPLPIVPRRLWGPGPMVRAPATSALA
eukprot:568622-Heterocapsa_arctica.AAC.1